MPMSVPFDLRLENPPPDFIGRAAEIAELQAVLKAAPCVEVHGPPGIGKSALVRHVLGRRRAKHAPIRLELLPDAPTHERILDGLRRASQQTAGRAPGGAPRAWYVTALELAEAQRRWIVIEDFDLAPEADRTLCLRLIAEHARRSRWIFVSRRPTPCDAAVLRVPVSGLDAALLGQLVERRLRVTSSAVSAAVRLSGGSPRAALQYASGVGDDPWRVPAAERAAASRLALSQVALPERLLGATPASLIARGVVEAGPDGARAHGAARSAWCARWPTELAAERVALADALVADPSLTLQAEGVRLLSVAGDLDRLDAALTARCEALLSAGYSLGLWQSVRRLGGADRWRLRIAAALGTRDALAWLPDAPPSHDHDRHWWAYCRLLRGEFARALKVAEPLADTIPAAGLTAALCQMNLGRFSAAEQRLARRPDDLRWAIRRAACLVQLDRRDAARALALGILKAARLTPSALTPTDTFALARAFLDLEDFSTAATLLDDLPVGQIGGGATAARLAQYHVAEHRGDFERIAALDADLRAHAGSDLLGTSVELARLRSALLLGRMEDYERRLGRVTVAVGQAGLPANFHQVPAADYGRLRGRPPTPWVAAPDAVAGPVYERWAARHGHPPTRRWRETPGQRALGALASAEHRLGQGAAADLTEALALARNAGLGGVEVDALCAACDAAIIAQDGAALTGWIEALARVATGSPRYEALIGFYRWASAPDDFGALEALNGVPHVAPCGARRAGAILGESVALDAVDRHVVAALPHAVRLVAGHGAGWGIDATRRTIWRAEGPQHDLARRPVTWALLHALGRAGGAAGKAALVDAIWGESYHPLRHDNRLQVAVRAARMLIEVDPQQPARLVTRGAGYALGGPCGVHGFRPA